VAAYWGGHRQSQSA
jgi:hypothetical protein